jgi:hypothetical protein
MRGTQALTAAAKISDTCSALGAGSSHPQVRTFWNLAAAMFEAQHHGLLGFDVFTKRVASRLLAQLRLLERGDSDVSERLARDALFFCAQAAPAGRGTRVPRLDAVREAYGFADDEPTDYSQSVLGRFDPAVITHAKKRRRRGEGSVAGDRRRRAASSRRALRAVRARRRFAPAPVPVRRDVRRRAAGCGAADAGSAGAPPAPLAMEVATSLLYLEAALEDGDFDQPEHAERIKRLGERLGRVRQKSPPDPLEPWMEELYRRVSDRQTMGSVVQELRASLLEVEKAIDKFFRNPSDASVLSDVPVQLGSMRGVLSVLGVDAAAQALVRMRSEIDGLTTTEVDPAKIASAGVFERIAGNLSALGFMIDMLSVQPQMAKSLFVYDAAAGTLAPVMGRSASPKPPPIEIRLLEQAQMLAFTSVREDVPVEEVKRDLERLSQEAHAADQPALAAACQTAQEALGAARDDTDIASARAELSEALVDFVATFDRAGRAGAGQRADAARADQADRARRGLRARRRDARGLPRGGSRGRRDRALGEHAAAQRARGSRPDDDAPARVPHAQGQLAHGRAEGVRRGGVGVRAGLQHPARRAARRRGAAARLLGLGAQLPRRLDRGHRRPSQRAAQRARRPDRRRQARRHRRRRRAGGRHRAADRIARGLSTSSDLELLPVASRRRSRRPSRSPRRRATRLARRPRTRPRSRSRPATASRSSSISPSSMAAASRAPARRRPRQRSPTRRRRRCSISSTRRKRASHRRGRGRGMPSSRPGPISSISI